ncbi:MAG: proton-conducting transporter membrane subunit, partial [Cyclobacteriaceae bacterium]|nr:proton-conducting transporter membrane subunit [Cyclobacteriaceae bacterium]
MESLNQSLEQIMAQVIVLLPELWLMGGSILVLMAGLWLDRRVQPLLVALVLALSFYFVRPVSGLFFDGMLVFDDLAYAIRKILLAGTGALLLFGKSKHHRPEFYFLMIAVLTGSFFMLSVVNFLLVYLAIELTSYGSYFLSGFRFTLKSSESSLKYLLFGGISSAVMLYGISLLYGAGGGLVMTGLEDTPLVRTGLVLFM